MNKSKKIIIGVASTLIISTIGISTLYNNIKSNKKQENVKLVVKDNSKVTKKSSNSNSLNNKDDKDDKDNKDNKSSVTFAESEAELVKTPNNSTYEYNKDLNRADGFSEEVKDDNWYIESVKNLANKNNKNNASEDEKNNLVNVINTLESQLKDVRNRAINADWAVTPEIYNLQIDIYENYFNGTSEANRNRIQDMLSQFDLSVDLSNLKLSHDGNSSLGDFNLFLVDSSGSQYLYIVGNYNYSTNKISNLKSTYLKDGAVARDKLSLSSVSSQTAQANQANQANQ